MDVNVTIMSGTLQDEDQIFIFGLTSEHFKDTNDGGGYDSQDGSNGNRLLGIPQVTWPVWTSHYTWGIVDRKRSSNLNYYFFSWNSIHILTSDRWEVDADQQSEKSSDVIDYVGHFDVLGAVTSPKRW